jgi:uncharacterized protein (TIGR01777 family)
MRIAITGSSGLIGSALGARLRQDGHDVVPVVRGRPGAGEIGWSPSEGRIDDHAFEDIDAVVHLAGAGIGDHRWTDEYKREILESRTRGTALVSEAIAAAEHGPATLLSASGIDYYGSDPDAELDESSPPGDGFLADVCVRWEQATELAAERGARVVNLRSGIVLSPDGGALARQLPIFKLGLGGRFAGGRPWQSWISIDDEIGAIVHLLHSAHAGPANLTAPHPVRQAEFASTLGAVLHRPAVLPIPSFGPRLLFGSELVDTLLLTGQKVVPRVLLADGYEFRHPELEPALRAVLGR